MTVSKPSAPGTTRSQVRFLVWIMIVFDLIVAGLAAWTLVNSRRQYVGRAEVVTHNLALVLEQNLMANVRQIDLVLQSVRDEAERRDASTRGIESHLLAQFTRVALLDSLRSTDPEGRLEFDARPGSNSQTNLANRPFFQQLRESPQAGLFISAPSRDGMGGTWVITLARRMQTAKGEFRGVVFATVRLDKLTRELAQVEIGKHGSISLRGGNLELLARYPEFPGGDNAIGDNHISGDYLEAVNSGRQASYFTTPSRIDGQVRTYTFRRLSNPAFFILVGLAQSEYLAAWRREATLSSAAVLGLLTLSFGIAWLARTAWRRQLEGQAERDQLISELTLALTEVKNLKGMLPICGHCKKIRDDQGYWNQMETYISEHTAATFSHGVCPECAQEMRQELQTRRDQKAQS